MIGMVMADDHQVESLDCPGLEQLDDLAGRPRVQMWGPPRVRDQAIDNLPRRSLLGAQRSNPRGPPLQLEPISAGICQYPLRGVARSRTEFRECRRRKPTSVVSAIAARSI